MDANWTMCASNWTDEPRTHRDASGRVKSSEDPARAHPWWLATVPAGRETDTYYRYKLTEFSSCVGVQATWVMYLYVLCLS